MTLSSALLWNQYKFVAKLCGVSIIFCKPLIIFVGVRICVLYIIRAWSLFCSIRIYISLHFLPVLLKKLVFLFFCVLLFCIFCFYEFNVIFTDFLYNTCVIIISIGTKCSMILLPPRCF